MKQFTFKSKVIVKINTPRIKTTDKTERLSLFIFFYFNLLKNEIQRLLHIFFFLCDTIMKIIYYIVIYYVCMCQCCVRFVACPFFRVVNNIDTKYFWRNRQNKAEIKPNWIIKKKFLLCIQFGFISALF